MIPRPKKPTPARENISGIDDARKAKRAEAAKTDPQDEGIIVGDFRDCADKIADGSLVLIVTNPPYPVPEAAR